MKVLRPGRPPAAEWSREVTCTGDGNGRRGCKALLLIGKDDLFKTTGQGIVWFATFKCPECGEMTDIEALGDRPAIVPVDIQVNLMPRLAWEALQFQRTDAAQQATTDGNVRVHSSSRPCPECSSSYRAPNPFCPDCRQRTIDP